MESTVESTVEPAHAHRLLKGRRAFGGRGAIICTVPGCWLLVKAPDGMPDYSGATMAAWDRARLTHDVTSTTRGAG